MIRRPTTRLASSSTLSARNSISASARSSAIRKRARTGLPFPPATAATESTSRRRSYFAMPIFLDPRKKPPAVKIHVSTGAGVDITWADGHASHYDFPYLRDECPCATCSDEREKKK